jgi:hypothetical protein
MRKLIFLLALLLLLNICWAQDTKEKEIRQEIILYNLVNGLYLNKEQVEFILGKAKEVEKLQEMMRRRLEDENSKDIDALLLLREEVKKEVPAVSPTLAKELHQRKVKKAQIHKEYTFLLEKKAEEVRAILDDNQLYLLENFQPCLIPPKGPVRIGQNPSNFRGSKLLERIRKIPFYKYESKKYEIVDRLIERFVLLHPYLKEKELKKAGEEFIGIMDEARALNEVDFKLQKQDIILRVKEILKKDKNVDVEKKIAHFLLHPSIIPILEEREN